MAENNEKSRILGIGDFWADEEKYIVNPVIIGVQENIGYQMENMLNRTSQGQKHQYANHQRIETATITLEPWQTHTCGVCGNSYAVSWQQLEAGGLTFATGPRSGCGVEETYLELDALILSVKMDTGKMLSITGHHYC